MADQRKTSRHLSGRGGNQKPFATGHNPANGQEIKIPVNRGVVTAFYVANADGGWPKRDVMRVDADLPSVQEGAPFWLEECRAGEGMGEMVEYRVAEVRAIGRRFDSRFGQLLRQILLVPVANADTLGDLSAVDLLGRG